MLKPKTLKNGMRVHLVPVVGTEATTVLVSIKVGSRYEPLNIWGGSHFIEHLMFKGTRRRPKAAIISAEVERYGAEYNAYTGKDRTGYYIKIASEKVPIAIDILHDMLFGSLYVPAEMNRERKVIIEEIKMYEENPMMHVEDLLEDAMFAGSTLGRNIAGTPEAMMKTKRSDLIAYRDAYYAPENMVIVVAGNVPKNTMALLEKTFGKVERNMTGKPFAPLGTLATSKIPRVNRQKKEVKQVQIALGFPSVGKDHPDAPALAILAHILGGGMSARLFVEVRERRGLCYHVRAASDHYEDIGTFVVRSGLDSARLPLAAKTIFTELTKIKKHGVTATELRNAKDHVDGATKLSMEDSSAQAEFVASQELFLGKVESLEEKLAKFRKVTQKDVQRVANNILDFSRLTIAGIGPWESDEELLKQFGY